MKFTKPWALLQPADEGGTPVPILDMRLRKSTGGYERQVFVVDSGADVSMAPRWLCDMLGLVWNTGAAAELRGISPRDECVVAATVHVVEVHIVEADRRLYLPFCFADGDAPLLIGRDGFFDAFRIQFDKSRYLTTFEW
jgi:hypothetical protein